MVNGKQFTIVWYVDELKLSHKEPSYLKNMIDEDQSRQKNYYLGMEIYYFMHGKVNTIMEDDLKKLIKEFPEDITGR